MKKIAIIFPGQGSQSIGMGKSLYEGFASARAVFDAANDALGYDLKGIAFSGPAVDLDRTENTQPALLTAGVAAFRVLSEEAGAHPVSFAGHSLGEFTALCASGVLDFKDAVRLVHLRGRFMQESVPYGVGKMSAIIGLGLGEVIEVCASASTAENVVVAANVNGLQQVVISGHAGAVDRAGAIAKLKGAKMIAPLQVSAPSHSPLMKNAAERLAEELKGIGLRQFNVPVYSNVEAALVADPTFVPGLLVRQLTSPVLWVDIIKRMKADGVTTLIEAGPGKVLTGLVKRIEPSLELLNFGEASDLDKVKAALR
ncbi:MAG: ACP S-malonyltransferase [Deltaproteobacteria bacterium]|nr:ACP S-malonyltransferase [Deltaproteobacteria bacterium]